MKLKTFMWLIQRYKDLHIKWLKELVMITAENFTRRPQTLKHFVQIVKQSLQFKLYSKVQNKTVPFEILNLSSKAFL
jgi:undecaprenyl pyrophosphate synthase